MVKCTKKQIRQLKTALRWKLPVVQRERIQMVLLRENGMTQPAIAEAMGVSLALLAQFAKAGGAGEMLNSHDLKAAYEKAIGHRTSNSTVYSLLARHGWRKLMPRPFHPDRDVEAQNAFKKRAFLMLSGKLGGPLRPAIVVYGSCSPTKRGSAG
jgi:Winged helix-turn helix